MADRLVAPLRAIVGHHTDERGIDILHLSPCGHETPSIGPAPSFPDRRRCTTCAPAPRGAAGHFIATDSIPDDGIAAAAPPSAASRVPSSLEDGTVGGALPGAPLTTDGLARRPLPSQTGTFPDESVDQAFRAREAAPAVLALEACVVAPAKAKRAVCR
jgi:hypothetical protein